MGELIEILVRVLIHWLAKSGKGSPRESEQQQRDLQRQYDLWQAELARTQRVQKLTKASGAAQAYRPGASSKSQRRVPPALPTAKPMAAADARTAAQPAKAITQAADAPAIAKWMRPATLKSQFVLTEILRPPVGLRRPRI